MKNKADIDLIGMMSKSEEEDTKLISIIADDEEEGND